MDFLKNRLIGERKKYDTQVTSWDYCQLELEYVYKKAGGTNNNIIEENIELVDEKNNKYDPKALAIYVYNLKIGYVPASHTDLVRSFKHKEKLYIRVYYYNEKYRAELSIIYR